VPYALSKPSYLAKRSTVLGGIQRGHFGTRNTRRLDWDRHEAPAFMLSGREEGATRSCKNLGKRLQKPPGEALGTAVKQARVQSTPGVSPL
jgi:hypothetical protein